MTRIKICGLTRQEDAMEAARLGADFLGLILVPSSPRFDWSLLATYERNKPFFLSGGLDPDNVVAAITLVRPDAIDVSSGVESEPGVKDHAKLARLIERMRRAEARPT